MTVSHILLSLLIGALGGVVAALCGVGGGVVMVPAFVALLALPHKQAVATSLLVIVPTALMASIQNQKNGFGDWRVAVCAAVAASLTAWFAADWLRQWSDEKLVRFFGVILVLMGARMLLLGRA
ncbi:MAG: TSUP family transporter [Roseimicrobium sp.]